MPYKIGKNEKGTWKVIAHSNTREKVAASIRARHAGNHNPNWK